VSETVDVPWAVTPEKVEAVVRKIVEVSRPVRIILFGSYVRGKTDRNSDLDALAVTDDAVKNPRKEAVRIRRALRSTFTPMDILVAAASKRKALEDRPGLIYREAARARFEVSRQMTTVRMRLRLKRLFCTTTQGRRYPGPEPSGEPKSIQ